jgi:hypothetical protein
MNLQDRIRRWWSPARWKDDHPSQATESAEGANKHWWQGGGWFSRNDGSNPFDAGEFDNLGPNIERDFKKPR